MAAPGESDIFHHVRDASYFHFPFETHLKLPHLFGFQLTKYMVLQLVAGFFLLFVYRGLARRVASGVPPKGPWWNFWEALALYVRDYIVRPTIGVPHDSHGGHGHDTHGHDGHGHEAHGHDAHDHAAHDHGPDAHALDGLKSAPLGGHPADRYLPFVWSCFFYVLICNLLGAIPWMGSPTSEINVTLALAVVTCITVIAYGVQRSGPLGFLFSLVPHMDISPPPLKWVLVVMIFGIEFVGFIIKHGVLAIRLFANMMGGHTVIAVIMLFIAIAAHSSIPWLYYVVVPSSIFGQIFVGVLEVLFAFVQAYIFAFLATLFISMAVHPH
jgi:F-type H+-transporting ATPase subunit a